MVHEYLIKLVSRVVGVSESHIKVLMLNPSADGGYWAQCRVDFRGVRYRVEVNHGPAVIEIGVRDAHSNQLLGVVATVGALVDLPVFSGALDEVGGAEAFCMGGSASLQ